MVLITLTLVACKPNNPENQIENPHNPLSPDGDWQLKINELGLSYPPEAIHILLFKQQKKTEIWVESEKDRMTFVESFPFETTGSKKGPRLYVYQSNLPEGSYKVDTLFPDDEVLKIKTDYPNDFDLRKMKPDKRQLKDDKFFIATEQIEGAATAIMPRNTLRALINLVNSVNHSEIIVFPEDPRPNTRFKPCYPCTEWYVELYSMLEETLKRY